MSSAPRPPTLQTVADAAGVSTALVSFALNGRPGVSEAKRTMILRVADELGYQVNPAARELRTGRIELMGLVVRNIANPFFNDVLAGMQHAAFEAEVTVVAMDSDYSGERERVHVQRLAARRVSGLAVAPVGAGGVVEQWRRLAPGGRLVLLNTCSSIAGGAPTVSPDAHAAVTGAFEHLWELGHRRIGFLTAPPELMADRDRFSRYEDLCAERSVPSLPLFADLHTSAIERRVAAALEGPEPVTAIITNSDFAAHRVYLTARRLGLTVGRDLSVVGHDDLESSVLLDPPLTTVAVDRRRIGGEIFRRLNGDADDDFRAPVRLVERSSTGPVPRDATSGR
jgi:DNA-binding LacI/PurR family transcriptional regulator